MWGNFVDDFRAAPYPKDWDKKGFVPGTGDTLSWAEVRGDYYEHLDEAREPHQARQGEAGAQDAASTDSVKYQYFDEYSRNCEEWLAKNYKAEYHVVDELRGAPTLVERRPRRPPPPLILGGTLWHPRRAPAPVAPRRREVVARLAASSERTPTTAKKQAEEEVSRARTRVEDA